MERLVQVNRDQLAAELQKEVQSMLARVMDAVNSARDGHLIDDSEEPVFHLMKELECRVFQKALQMRIDSTESSFSPTEGLAGQKQAQQGAERVLAADANGSGQPVANAILRPGRRQRRATGPSGR
jgi:hypothetical protein